MKGTSPRMRGKHPGAAATAGLQWNIPAYAGKTSARWPGRPYHQEHPRVCGETSTAWRPPPNSPEHPRVCGENIVVDVRELQRAGTSPRMRGKLTPVGLHQILLRNIPAYAGKTVTLIPLRCRDWEHPRVCGENDVAHRTTIAGGGTSPRMRGKLFEGVV